MGQPNFGAFNKWTKVWVAGSLKKKHWSIIQGQYCLKHTLVGPLHWEMVVAECLETFETWLPLENFDDVKWIGQCWVEMCLKKYASGVREARKKGRGGNKRLETDLGECACDEASGNVPELPYITFVVLICFVPNSNNGQTSSD
jgi:hypothetical protein